jgi:hypothetical protein
MKTETEVLPQDRLMQTLFAFMLTKAVSAAASLGVADALKSGGMYYTDLAKAVGADTKPLHRMMRTLSAAGIFTESKPGQYELNPVSDLLRSDHPASMRDMATMITSESHWVPWGFFTETVRSGKSGPQHAFGTDVFTWFQREENRAEWEIFNSAMTSFSSGVAPLVPQAYDFNRFRTIVDIGGGHGLLVRKILESAPQAKGIVFDLPGVGEDGEIGERITRASGDFFKAVPARGDCYTLKHILHDWSDEHCRKILGNIAKVMSSDGRVLVIEIVMPEHAEPHPAKFMDINMLAMTEGGCERTEQEYRELFEASGLKLLKVHPTRSLVSLVEAGKA